MAVPQSSAGKRTAQRSVLEDVFMSVFEVGVNRGVILVMHGTFVGLVGALLLLAAMTAGQNVHVWILLAITLFLYLAIVW